VFRIRSINERRTEMKGLWKFIDELFYLRPLELALVAGLVAFVGWGFLVLLFSLEIPK